MELINNVQERFIEHKYLVGLKILSHIYKVKWSLTEALLISFIRRNLIDELNNFDWGVNSLEKSILKFLPAAAI